MQASKDLTLTDYHPTGILTLHCFGDLRIQSDILEAQTNQPQVHPNLGTLPDA